MELLSKEAVIIIFIVGAGLLLYFCWKALDFICDLFTKALSLCTSSAGMIGVLVLGFGFLAWFWWMDSLIWDSFQGFMKNLYSKYNE